MSEEDATSALEEDPRATVLEVARRPGNTRCADCEAFGEGVCTWAVVNWGTFICTHCAGAHRQMGTHVSRVRSVTLDAWTLDEVEFVRAMGNERANSIWEQEMLKGWRRPSAGADHAERARFVEAKYVHQRFFGATVAPKAPDDADLRRRSTLSHSVGEAGAAGLSRMYTSLGLGERSGGGAASARAAHRQRSPDAGPRPVAVLLLLGHVADYPLSLEREFVARIRRRVSRALQAVKRAPPGKEEVVIIQPVYWAPLLRDEAAAAAHGLSSSLALPTGGGSTPRSSWNSAAVSVSPAAGGSSLSTTPRSGAGVLGGVRGAARSASVPPFSRTHTAPQIFASSSAGGSSALSGTSGASSSAGPDPALRLSGASTGSALSAAPTSGASALHAGPRSLLADRLAFSGVGAAARGARVGGIDGRTREVRSVVSLALADLAATAGSTSPLVVVAHGLGSVVATCVLRELPASAARAAEAAGTEGSAAAPREGEDSAEQSEGNCISAIAPGARSADSAHMSAADRAPEGSRAAPHRQQQAEGGGAALASSFATPLEQGHTLCGVWTLGSPLGPWMAARLAASPVGPGEGWPTSTPSGRLDSHAPPEPTAAAGGADDAAPRSGGPTPPSRPDPRLGVRVPAREAAKWLARTNAQADSLDESLPPPPPPPPRLGVSSALGHSVTPGRDTPYWVNLFHRSDPLAAPLRPTFNSAEDVAMVDDVHVTLGTPSATGLAGLATHSEYLGRRAGNEVVGPIADHLARIWMAANPPASTVNPSPG